MSKKHKHEEHVNHERWLVSYADFITLLFAFFVVLFSSSQVDRSKTNKMALAMEAAFEEFSIFKEGGGELDVLNMNRTPEANDDGSGKRSSYDPTHFFKSADEINTGDATAGTGQGYGFDETGKPIDEGMAFSRATRDLMTLLDRLKLQSAVSVTKDEDGITISMNESGVFDSGSKDLSKKSEEVLRGIGAILTRLPHNEVRVEGNTDNQSNWSNTNWDLSAARATSVVKWFLGNFKLDPARFAAVGYGEYHPVADNATEEGRKKNRRVDIVIVSLKDKLKKPESLTEASAGENPTSGTRFRNPYLLNDEVKVAKPLAVVDSSSEPAPEVPVPSEPPPAPPTAPEPSHH